MRVRIMAVALLALVSRVPCVAQTYYGGLRGTVTDPTGQAIAGGTLKLKSETTNMERSTITNGYGDDVKNSINTTPYTATVTDLEFKNLVRTRVGDSIQKGLTPDF